MDSPGSVQFRGPLAETQWGASAAEQEFLCFFPISVPVAYGLVLIFEPMKRYGKYLHTYVYTHKDVCKKNHQLWANVGF